jgi:hypothetical protein
MKTFPLVAVGLLALTLLGGARAGVKTTFYSSTSSIQVVTRVQTTPVRYVWRSAGVKTLKTYKTSARVLKTVQNPSRRGSVRQVQVAASGTCLMRANLPLSFRQVFGSTVTYRSSCPTGTVRLKVRLEPKTALRVWRAENVTPRIYTLRLYRVTANGRLQSTKQVRTTTVLQRSPILSTVSFKLSS